MTLLEFSNNQSLEPIDETLENLVKSSCEATLKYEKFAKKNIDKEKRHDDNEKKLIEENEQLAKETEEKQFQKYINLYFMKKSQKINMNNQKKKRLTKFNEKAERLEEIDKKNEERRRNLIKKMKDLDSRRSKYIRERFDRILLNKMERDEKSEKCIRNQKMLEDEEFKRREIILENQTISINNSMNITRRNDMRRMAAGENIINNQIAIQKSLFNFNKKLNELKSRSVNKMTQEEKMKLFRELKSIKRYKKV